MMALAVYVVGRFLVFAVLLFALWAVGLDGLLSAVIAVVASIPVSYVVLRRPRARATAALEARARRKAELRARLRDS